MLHKRSADTARFAAPRTLSGDSPDAIPFAREAMIQFARISDHEDRLQPLEAAAWKHD
jgi:hypothetical protein